MKRWNMQPDARDIVFRPAMMPLEAAVIPAGDRAYIGALSMAPHAYEAIERRKNQRAKIWVR